MLQDADGQDLPSNFEKGVRESSGLLNEALLAGPDDTIDTED